jgi:DNA-binding transcriptional MerR regulator
MTVGDISIESIRELLNELESQTADLELPEAEGQELAAEIATVKAQIDSPKPKKQIIRESLHTIRSILEGISGNLAAAPLLELIKHIL